MIKGPVPSLRPVAALLFALAGAASGASPHSTAPPSASRDVQAPWRDTLAWVGPGAITADDLLRRIELMPWPEKRGPTSMDSARVRALQSLVAERLLAREAERLGLGDSGIIPRAREALRKALARDALYRDVTKTEPADEFMIRLLDGQRASLDSATFALLADTLWSLTRAHRKELAPQTGIGAYCDALMERLEPALERPLARLPGGPLRLGQAIEALRFYAFVLRSQERRAFAAELSASFKQVVEGELMAREALRRGLDKRPDVRRDLDLWTRAWRAQLLIERVALGPGASDDDAFRWLARFEPDRARQACEVDVAEILSGSWDTAARLRAQLDAGADFDSLARRFTQRAEWSTRGGRSGFFPVPQHPLLGYAALLAPADSLFGPIRLREGFTLFRVLGKRIAPDSLAARELLDQAHAHATATRRTERLTRYVAALASREAVRFDYDALRRVDVASFNLVTKRLLGFGGGMFAAPPLPPLWEWVRIGRGSPTSLP